MSTSRQAASDDVEGGHACTRNDLGGGGECTARCQPDPADRGVDDGAPLGPRTPQLHRTEGLSRPGKQKPGRKQEPDYREQDENHGPSAHRFTPLLRGGRAHDGRDAVLRAIRRDRRGATAHVHAVAAAQHQDRKQRESEATKDGSSPPARLTRGRPRSHSNRRTGCTSSQRTHHSPGPSCNHPTRGLRATRERMSVRGS
jgi:hypothetical protein